MKKALSTLLIVMTAGLFFATGSAIAAPRLLSGDIMDTISGERGIAVPESSQALHIYSERDTEVNREILRRNNVSDYPVELTDSVLTQYTTLQTGQASGKTFNDLIDEATPGRLPQFFIDEAQRVATP